jgi:hypothetical protein
MSDALVDGIEIVNHDTGEVEDVIEINPPQEENSRSLIRTDRGLNINLNHLEFFTRFRFVEDE